MYTFITRLILTLVFSIIEFAIVLCRPTEIFILYFIAMCMLFSAYTALRTGNKNWNFIIGIF
jgi:hypothetical protein